MKRHAAPWSTSLLLMTSLASSVCLVAGVMVILKGRGWLPWAALIPFGMLIGGALFTIRGYTVTAEAILVERLFWKTRVPLSGLQSVESKPDAMRWSLRTFGNGGLFSITGCFYNKALGSYRAFVTDPHLTVVLRFTARTVVISPSAPEEFVQELGIMHPLV